MTTPELHLCHHEGCDAVLQAHLNYCHEHMAGYLARQVKRKAAAEKMVRRKADFESDRDAYFRKCGVKFA